MQTYASLLHWFLAHHKTIYIWRKHMHFLVYIYLVCVAGNRMHAMCKSKRIACDSQVSPTATWVQGFELRALLGFVASTLITL